MGHGYSQKNRLLRIQTKLDWDPNEKEYPKGTPLKGDPLLLVKLDGKEGISQLFAYDIVMLRDCGEGKEGEHRPPLDPYSLIGTPVWLAAAPSPESDETPMYWRFGMFETVEEVKTVNEVFLLVQMRGFLAYSARVVPWVTVLGRDVSYRIFEQKTVVQITDAVVDEAQKAFPYLHIDIKDQSNGENRLFDARYWPRPLRVHITSDPKAPVQSGPRQSFRRER